MMPMMPIMPFDSTTVPLERGTTLIEASAGTGKTFSIAALFLRFVLEEHLPVQKILAVTYTVAATQELRDRIRKRMREALAHLRGEGEAEGEDPVVAEFLRNGGDVKRAVRELDLAVQSFDEAPIFTIHGFCQRALQDHAFESGSRYAAETLADASSLMDEVATDFWRRTFYDAPPFLAALALAGEFSSCPTPEPWLTLLQRTRNHPSLVILPEPDAEPSSQLGSQAAEAFARLCKIWESDRAAITEILHNDKGLTRNAKSFRADRVSELLAAVERLATASDESGIAAEDINALASLRTQFIAGCLKKGKAAPEHPFFEACEVFCQLAERFFAQLYHEMLSYAETELARRKKQLNVLTFDDLLTRLHGALQGAMGDAVAASLGAKYEVALIDEFQDTDPMQAAIFQRVFSGGKHWLFLIGDPKQAIYGFRGADVFAYLNAASCASRHYGLEVNWRSDAPLLNGFNAFFLQVSDPFVIEKINYVPVQSSPAKTEGIEGGAPLVFRHLAVAAGEPPSNKDRATEGILEALVADIEAQKGQFRLNEIAVLVRKGRQAKAVQDALRERGLPAVLYTEESVLQTPEAEVMQRLLEAVADPRGGGRIKAALATTLFGLDASAIAELETGGEVWLERFIEWRALWEQGGFIAMFRRVLTGQAVRRRLVELPGGERRLTNILHLAELLHQEETTRKLGPEALCGWLWEQRSGDRSAGEAAQLRLESDAEAISIVTIHKSKGLEYPVVFCPFLWEPAESSRNDTLCFHDEQGRITLDLRGKSGGSQEHVARAEEETLAEEVRLLYVAVTRAKHRCYVYSADYRDLDKSPLARLFPDREVRRGIDALICAAPESVALHNIKVVATEVEASVETSHAVSEAQPRRFRGSLARTAYITSFTGLTAGTAREEPERDQPVGEEVPETEPMPIPLRREGPVHGIHLFEKGARAGDFFHEVMERLDFRNPGELEALVPEALAIHGFGGNPHEAAIKEKLEEVLEVELEPGLTLAQVGREDRLSEVDFACRLPSLCPEDLRNLFGAHDVPTLTAAELGRLKFSPVTGFLRGAIDLFFRHGDRYYLLDWKSNWLGTAPEDYDAPGVEAAMRSHHYALQAHLYVLAADCYLHARLPGYDYERHFGGVFYLFLRGVERGNSTRGICRIRPSFELLKEMRKLTEGQR